MADAAPTPNTPPANQSAPANGPTGDGQQGGDSNAQGAAPQPPAQPAGQQNDPAPTPTPPTQPAGSESSEQSGDGEGLENATPEQLLAEVKRLRKENARDRTTAKENAAQQAQQELIDKLAGALGIKPAGEDGDGETPTVEDLTAQLERERESKRTQAVEFAAWRNAGEFDVNPEALLNLRSFHDAVRELDPASDTFEADVKKAIEAEKKNSPFIVTTPQTPGRSGNQLNNQRGAGGAPGDEGLDPAGLAAAVQSKKNYY